MIALPLESQDTELTHGINKNTPTPSYDLWVLSSRAKHFLKSILSPEQKAEQNLVNYLTAHTHKPPCQRLASLQDFLRAKLGSQGLLNTLFQRHK